MEDIKYSKNVCILQTRDQLPIEAFSQKTLHEIIPLFFFTYMSSLWMIMLKCLSNTDTYQHVHYNSVEPSWLSKARRVILNTRHTLSNQNLNIHCKYMLLWKCFCSKINTPDKCTCFKFSCFKPWLLIYSF